jgi:hypothetical protein
MDAMQRITSAIGRFLALENPANEDSILAKRIQPFGTIADQTTGRDRLAPLINCGNRIAACQSDDLRPLRRIYTIGMDGEEDYNVAWRSLGLRSRWRALRPKNIA